MSPIRILESPIFQRADRLFFPLCVCVNNEIVPLILSQKSDQRAYDPSIYFIREAKKKLMDMLAL